MAMIIGESSNQLRGISVKATPEEELFAKNPTPLTPEQLAFYDLIDSIIMAQMDINMDLVKEARVKELMRYDFLRSVNPEMDRFITSKMPDVESFTKSFYEHGKKLGYDQMKVDAFTSNVDTRALFNLNRYDFNLIKNLSIDLQADVQRTVWRGVANNQTTKEITRRLAKLPIEPLKVNNRVISAKTRAEMIAKTETMRARNQGLFMTYEEYNIPYWNTLLGKNPCPRCLRIHNAGPYPLEDFMRPPFHTRCECTPEPVGKPVGPVPPKSYMDLTSADLIKV